jgi:Tfp pilus assembly protein PilN
MPQQINLCLPILLTPKRYFSAQTLAQALAVCMLVGGGFSTYWVWSLNRASDGLNKLLLTQASELTSLQAAMAQNRAAVVPDEATWAKELQTQRTELTQRETLLNELQRGLFRPGWGHSARLQLVAQSIPAQVWVTEVKADESLLDVHGFTLEPAALNDWVAKLAGSPLLQEQKLSTVLVENASSTKANATVPASVRPVWSFHMLSAVGAPAPFDGGKP